MPVMPVTADVAVPALSVGSWSPVSISVALGSGASEHILDAEEAPGYQVVPSAGSRMGQNFVVGNGERIANEGEVLLNLDAPGVGGAAVPVQTAFQVAEITRPLMSVARI